MTRLFFYYASRSFKNQLKKIFKTWVMVFLAVCLAFGILLGVGLSLLGESLGEPEDPGAVGTDDPGTAESETDPGTDTGENAFLSREEQLVLLELAVGGIVLIVFTVNALTGDKSGSQIFLPADTTLLFPAPARPQSVLMFRLLLQLGAAVFASGYMAFQIPNLVRGMDLPPFAGIALFCAWLFLLFYSKLLGVLIYTLASTYSRVKKYVRWTVYAVIALVFLPFFFWWKNSGVPLEMSGLLEAGGRFFCNLPMRLIPVAGWIKGFACSAAVGDGTGALLYFAALVLFIPVVCFFIWRIKADFYEDAQAKSEETAAALASAAEGGIVKRKKPDRGERILRDRLPAGEGARAYFAKALYNRRRFATLGFFTKSAITYLLVAALAVFLAKTVILSDSFVPFGLIVSFLCFYTSLGNPFAEDSRKDWFFLVPAAPFSKIAWSLCAGFVKNLFDLLPAYLVAAAALGFPAEALVWLTLSLGVNFYASSVGVFLDFAVPQGVAKTVKSIITISFLYFGLVPIAIPAVLGFVFDAILPAALASAAFSLALGAFFAALTAQFLKAGKK